MQQQPLSDQLEPPQGKSLLLIDCPYLQIQTQIEYNCSKPPPSPKTATELSQKLVLSELSTITTALQCCHKLSDHLQASHQLYIYHQYQLSKMLSTEPPKSLLRNPHKQVCWAHLCLFVSTSLFVYTREESSSELIAKVDYICNPSMTQIGTGALSITRKSTHAKRKANTRAPLGPAQFVYY